MIQTRSILITFYIYTPLFIFLETDPYGTLYEKMTLVDFFQVFKFINVLLGT